MDPATISLEKQRSQFVKDMVQAELFGHLKPKFLFNMAHQGELSERAYGLILQRQLRDGRIDDRAFDVWKTLDVPLEKAKKVESVDLKMQILHRKLDLHAQNLYKDEALPVLSDKRRQGTLSEVAYEAILESQKRRGLIDDTQLSLWRNG